MSHVTWISIKAFPFVSLLFSCFTWHVNNETERDHSPCTKKLSISPFNYSYMCTACIWLSLESPVQVRSNTSTVALRVVGGDEKGTQCLKYNRAKLFLRDINTGTWPSRLGESQIWDNIMWSWVSRDSNLRVTPLTRTSSNCKRQTHLLVRKDVR
jgi:hypothetical protein